ncbi:hypothetical protein KVT40_008084 [Elsinoe batatas]|uniref:Uncharacterized protein n=1 Tax=Elsinoe batatas TaxID=2601811 RepID=A0A8K0KZK2_9PEZI|nr:hypothetical protein KVT40_008084 [Elsinoe batatas]
MFRPTPVTPPSPSPPSLDRRNSDPCRAQPSSVPMTASSLLARMVAVATRQPVVQPEISSPTAPSFHEEKIEWETLSRRGSDPSQCGYISFPDFDRLSRSSASCNDDSSSN